MNNRIKELVKEAGLTMCGCGCDMPTRQSAKLAELIIKECVKAAENAQADFYVINNIKRLLGDKE